MEEKCLKTNIYLNDVLFCDSTEQAIDIDFTLPDFCPDISKIYKCRAVPRISSKGIDGKSITVDGAVVITLIYCDKDGNLSSYDYQYPFSKTLDMSEECAGANICCKAKCEYINCRAVTGRKVDIHGAVGIFLKVFKRKCTDIISDYDDTNIELLRGTAPATMPMGYAEKYIVIEEDVLIGQGLDSIGNIIRCDAVSCVKETKVMAGKTVVKGEINMSIIYCSQMGGNIQSLKTSLPFSQIIDVEGITDACECETKSEIAFFEAKPKMTSSEETRCFSVTAKVLLSCEAYCPNDVEVILDAFSRKYKSEITKSKVSLDKITENVSEIFHTKKNIELDDSITSVIDLWCAMSSVATRFEQENMVINGTLVCGMIVRTEKENDVYCEKTIDFQYKYPFKNELGTPHCEPKIEVISCGYTIMSPENIEIRADISINAAIYETNEMSLITGVNVDENTPITEHSKTALTIYFPSKDECVWDIARIYKASVEEIMRINSLESDKLKPGKMILVPVM